MRKFAVSYASLDYNELFTKIVEYPTNNWFECLIKAFPELEILDLPNDIYRAKDKAFDHNFLFEVVEIL